MGRGGRIGLIVAALAIAVVAFVLLRPGDTEDPGPVTTNPGQTTPADHDGQTHEGSETGPDGDQPEPEPEAEVVELELADGEVVGGTERIRVSRGDTVRLVVRSDTPDEIHVHGYDISRNVGPNKAARFRFEADLEGIFEVEAHDLGHLLVAELVVEP